MKKYKLGIILWVIFEIIAITLWKTQDEIFYFYNFSYIGASLGFGVTLLSNKYKYARNITQLLIGYIC